jgi:protein involved in polysaccharide export with SLBB domain
MIRAGRYSFRGLRWLSLPFLLALAWVAPNASAQAGAQVEADAVSANSGNAASLLLDTPVSRTQYTLGPGDVLTLSMFGNVNRLETLPVTPDGTVVIPSVGVLRVLGLNLDAAQARVRDLVLRLYRDVDVNLTLSRARLFKVFVVGDVPEPGLRIASPATRVSEVVPPIGNNGVVRRNVLIRRASGDTVDVDLVRFRQTGDLDANPPIREGDAVVVRAIDQTVHVFGRVHFPGRYEYREGESLAGFLSIINGSRDFPSNAADTIRLTRFINENQREFYTFSRAEALGPQGQEFILQPFDALYIAALSNFKRQRTAMIQGQVLRPGTYPIQPGVTTVRDLVALAGGFTPDASLTDATLQRHPEGAEGEGARELQNIPPEFLSEDERRILQIRARGGETNVVIEFEKLFAEGQDVYDQALESGDVLRVPERRSGVGVLGAVLQPGLVEYVPGQTIEFFVARAGGYGERADRNDIVVLKAKLDTRMNPKDVTSIDPGDKIIVPFRERRTFLERVAAANSVITTISGVVLTIVGLDRLFDAVRN